VAAPGTETKDRCLPSFQLPAGPGQRGRERSADSNSIDAAALVNPTAKSRADDRGLDNVAASAKFDLACDHIADDDGLTRCPHNPVNGVKSPD
jgi:hypothetical protein